MKSAYLNMLFQSSHGGALLVVPEHIEVEHIGCIIHLAIRYGLYDMRHMIWLIWYDLNDINHIIYGPYDMAYTISPKWYGLYDMAYMIWRPYYGHIIVYIIWNCGKLPYYIRPMCYGIFLRSSNSKVIRGHLVLKINLI